MPRKKQAKTYTESFFKITCLSSVISLFVLLLHCQLYAPPLTQGWLSKCTFGFTQIGANGKRSVHIKIDIPAEKLPAGISEENIIRWVFQYHDGYVPSFSSPSSSPTVESVSAALMGPPKGRPSHVEVSNTNLSSIQKTVKDHMAAGIPIEGVTFWGGAKQYGIGDHMGIDAADLFALLRYEAMDRSVRAAGYSPGVKVQLIFEDLGRRFMGGDTPQMRKRVYQYQEEMEKLVKITTSSVHFIPESKMIEQNEVPMKVREILNLDPKTSLKGTEQMFFAVAEKAENTIYRYLRKTEQAETKAPESADDRKGFDRVSKLAEYIELEKLGFKGGIPQPQRASVRNRTLLRLGNPQITEEDLDRHVAKYFAQGFARAIFNLRGSSTFTQGEEPLDVLSYSFLPYPPGTPESMIVRRVELAALEDTGGEKVVPCWGGCAVLTPDGNIQLRSQLARPETIIPIQLQAPDGTFMTVPLHYEEKPSPSKTRR